jgi:N-acetylneuraminate lyase
MINKLINGIIAAPFTPMDEEGEINLGIVIDYAQKLKKDGLSGVFICGTTGEGMSMTLDERKEIAEEWVKYQDDDFKVIVHVGTTSFKQSQELAQHAQKIGAYGSSVMGPLFLKPTTVEPLVDFCAKVASAAPDIPFFYYHIPIISGAELSMEDYLKIAQKKIPNLAGIKYTHDNLDEMQHCNTMNDGKWTILNGFDENLFKVLNLGIEAAVGSTYNYMNSIYLSLINDFKSGNLEAAFRKQQKCNDIIASLFENGGPMVAGKAMMKWVGVDCGPCRLPLTNLSDKSLSKLKKVLKAKGFFALNQ